MLELTLNLNQAAFTPGEPINGKVTLRNAGSDAVKVNGRLALNTPYSPADMREISFKLTDPTGAQLEFQPKVNLGSPDDGEFKTLQPGEALEASYNLARYYDLEKAGTYSVQAVYQNQSEPQSPNGKGVWKGEVVSPPAKFTVQS